MATVDNNINNTSRVSIFHINDFHAKSRPMTRVATAVDRFDKQCTEQGIDGLKISGGDINMGGGNDNIPKNHLAIKFLQKIGIDAAVLGNHEFDRGVQQLAKDVEKDMGYKYLGANLNVKPNSPLAEDVKSGNIVSSQIITKSNDRYGVIGALPLDLKKKVKLGAQYADSYDVDNFNGTAKEIQDEVNQLKKQGITKIILASHMGYEVDRKMASAVDGVDVIVGGHSHTLVEGVERGENFLKSKSGEDVVIVQAGKNGRHYGIVDVEFDENGRVVRAENQLIASAGEEEDSIFKLYENHYLGSAKTVGVIANTAIPTSTTASENPVADFLADSIRWKANADIALINDGGIRGGFSKGEVTDREIKALVPFNNKIVKVELTEAELVEILKIGAKSLKDNKYGEQKPVLIQLSGASYSVENGELKELFVGDSPVNVFNPNPFKSYSVAYNDFMFAGNEGMSVLHKPDSIIENYKWSASNAAIDYLKAQNDEPVEIKTDGRILVG